MSLSFLYILSTGLLARDINLDDIYIKNTSLNYKKLVLEKLETYKKIRAAFVDNNVIFAYWISGDEIIYIKESISLNTNFVFRYRPRDRRALELCRLSGAVTVAKTILNGKYLVIKRLIQAKSIIPHGEMVIVDLRSGRMRIRKSPYAFLDFSIAPEGNSILIENAKGISELAFDNSVQRVLLKRNEYSDIIISDNPCIAYISPDRKRILVVNGSGGNYRAKLITDNGKNIRIGEISSSSEVFWTDNFSFVYRTGYAGNFSVVKYNVYNNKKSYLLKGSYNTNIICSRNAEIISFLKEQLIHLYDNSEKNVVNTGLEGEDVSFDPNGNRFVALLYKKLFIINKNKIKKLNIELKRSWKQLYAIYKDMIDKKQYFKNNYSRYYIKRKIGLYRDLAGI